MAIAVAAAAFATGFLLPFAIAIIVDRLNEGEPNTACADCGSEIPCFNVPEKGTKGEMDRQLAEQQKAINDMSPDEILDNLDKFEAEGRPNDSGARRLAREKAWQEWQLRRQDELIKEGKSPGAAKAQAEQEATEWMKTQDATHDLDWVAGGTGTISGMGGLSENRSIGSQWTKEGEGGIRRRDALRKAAEAAKAAGKDKMDVRLSTCD